MRKVTLGAVLAVAFFVLQLVTFVPAVFATPTGVVWSPNPVSSSVSTTATVTVAVSSTCPSGDFWAVTNFEIHDPSNNGYAATIPSTPCGSSATITFPTDFTGLDGEPAPSTASCGSYFGAWGYAVLDAAGALLSTQGPFSGAGFTVNGCPNSVPQFPFGLAAVFALTIPLLLVLRKWGPAFKTRPV